MFFYQLSKIYEKKHENSIKGIKKFLYFFFFKPQLLDIHIFDRLEIEFIDSAKIYIYFFYKNKISNKYFFKFKNSQRALKIIIAKKSKDFLSQHQLRFFSGDINLKNA